MAGMLGERHYRAVLDLVGEAHDAGDLEDFRSVLLPGLRRLVPSEWASYNEIHGTAGVLATIAEPDIDQARPSSLRKRCQHLLDHDRQRQHAVHDHGRLAGLAREGVVQVHRVEVERGCRVALQSVSPDGIRHVNEHPFAGRRIDARRLTLVGLAAWIHSLHAQSLSGRRV